MEHEKHCTSDTRSAVANPPYSAAKKSSRYSEQMLAMGRDNPRNGVLRIGRMWLQVAHLIVEPFQPSNGFCIVDSEVCALWQGSAAAALCSLWFGEEP